MNAAELLEIVLDALEGDDRVDSIDELSPGHLSIETDGEDYLLLTVEAQQ